MDQRNTYTGSFMEERRESGKMHRQDIDQLVTSTIGLPPRTSLLGAGSISVKAKRLVVWGH